MEMLKQGRHKTTAAFLLLCGLVTNWFSVNRVSQRRGCGLKRYQSHNRSDEEEFLVGVRAGASGFQDQAQARWQWGGP